MKARLLVTGASGFVGSNLARLMAPRWLVVPAYRSRVPPPIPGATAPVPFDITDADQTLRAIVAAKPSVVVHIAGDKNVRRCEAEPTAAHRVNAEGTANVARACREAGARLLYLSTDLVFACDRGGYRERDVPEPQTHYGRSKLAGEFLAREECPQARICRSGGLYGPGSPLLGWLATELRAGRPVEAFTDIRNTPTYAADLAMMMQAILDQDWRGPFHCVGASRVSRWELFTAYARAFGLDERLVVPTDAGERSRQMLLQLDASIEGTETARRLGITLPALDDAMGRFRAEAVT